MNETGETKRNGLPLSVPVHEQSQKMPRNLPFSAFFFAPPAGEFFNEVSYGRHQSPQMLLHRWALSMFPRREENFCQSPPAGRPMIKPFTTGVSGFGAAFFGAGSSRNGPATAGVSSG